VSEDENESPPRPPPNTVLVGLDPFIFSKMHQCAEEDRLTHTGWIRYLVRKELERRGMLG